MGVDLEACYAATEDVSCEVDGGGRLQGHDCVWWGRERTFGGRIWRRAMPPPKMSLVRQREGESYRARLC